MYLKRPILAILAEAKSLGFVVLRYILSLTHKDDIRNVSKSSFTDEATIESFATRMPERHALIVGNVTDRYPLVVRVDDLPAGVPRSGRTRSTWDRFSSP